MTNRTATLNIPGYEEHGDDHIWHILRDCLLCLGSPCLFFSQVLNTLTSIALDHVSIFKNVLCTCWHFAISHKFLYQLKFH